jgi:hypothetical protein
MEHKLMSAYPRIDDFAPSARVLRRSRDFYRRNSHSAEKQHSSKRHIGKADKAGILPLEFYHVGTVGMRTFDTLIYTLPRDNHTPTHAPSATRK